MSPPSRRGVEQVTEDRQCDEPEQQERDLNSEPVGEQTRGEGEDHIADDHQVRDEAERRRPVFWFDGTSYKGKDCREGDEHRRSEHYECGDDQRDAAAGTERESGDGDDRVRNGQRPHTAEKARDPAVEYCYNRPRRYPGSEYDARLRDGDSEPVVEQARGVIQCDPPGDASQEYHRDEDGYAPECFSPGHSLFLAAAGGSRDRPA